MAENYKVLRIVPISKIGGTGDIEHYNRITAISAGGTQFTVDVTDADSTPEKVKPVLTKKAKELDAIKGL